MGIPECHIEDCQQYCNIDNYMERYGYLCHKHKFELDLLIEVHAEKISKQITDRFFGVK